MTGPTRGDSLDLDPLLGADPVAQIARYVVLRPLGDGPTGRVYTAYDPELDRKVRLKLLRPDGASQEHLLAEARRLARLNHPNIVAVHDFGEHHGAVYVATEFVRGATLRSWLAAPRTWQELAPPMIQVGRALAASHAVGLVHGEFTLDCAILGDDGCARVVDFGRGQAVDPAVDQLAYSLALRQALATAARVPRHVGRALERGLRSDPGERWPSMTALVDALERDPSRSRRALLACGGAAALLAGLLGAQRIERARRVERCEAVAAAISADWNDAARAAISAGMRATGAPFVETSLAQTTRSLDHQAAAWSRTARDGCLALDDGLQPRVTACLDERRAEFAALVTMLREPSAAQLALAVQAVTALTPAETCTDRTWLLRQTTEGPQSEALTLRAALARGSVAASLARFDEASATAQEVERRAEAGGLREVVARARLLRGAVLLERLQLSGAAEALESAFYEAGALGLDELAAGAAAELAFLVGVRQSRPAAGLAWARLAEMMRDRVDRGSDELGRAKLMHIRGQILAQRGDIQAGVRHLQDALALRERLLGPEHPLVVTSLKTLVGQLQALGRTAAALALGRRALGVSEQLFGTEHPVVAGLLVNIGGALTDQGDHAPARAAFARALDVEARVFGADSLRVVPPLGNLAVAEFNLGDYAQARVHAQRTRELLERALRPDHPHVAIILHLLVKLHLVAGESDEALALARRAVEIQERAVGTDAPSYGLALVQLGHVEVERGELERGITDLERARRIIEATLAREHAHYAEVLTFLGEARLLRGEHEAASALLTQALELRERNKTDAVDRAYTRFAVARALTVAGRGDAEERRAQARQAVRELLRFGPGGDRLRARIEAWLSSAAAREGPTLRIPG